MKYIAITPERLAALEQAEQALKDISSGSPALFNPGTPHEFKCSLCHGHIDHARRALGYLPWPAIPHTPKASKPQLTPLKIIIESQEPQPRPTNDAHLYH